MAAEILRNPGIDFYSGFRKIQVYTFTVASEKKTQGGGAIRKFEILKTPGIDFYSGFRKTSQGGGANLIPKKVGPPYPQILDPPLNLIIYVCPRDVNKL